MTGASQRVLLLHGYGHHRPADHWMRLLAGHLRDRGVAVQYPQLPSPENPDEATWREVARTEFELLGGGHTVVAHSLGTVLFASLAHELGDLAPARVALVSPPTRELLTTLVTGFATHHDAALDAATTIVVGRQRDPYRPVSLAQVAGAWGVPHIEVPGEGHLTPADGFGEYPGALTWCLGGESSAWLDTTPTPGDPTPL